MRASSKFAFIKKVKNDTNARGHKIESGYEHTIHSMLRSLEQNQPLAERGWSHFPQIHSPNSQYDLSEKETKQLLHSMSSYNKNITSRESLRRFLYR